MLEPLILSPDVFEPTQLENRANRSVVAGILADLCKAGAIMDFTGGYLVKTITNQVKELDSHKSRKIVERLKFLKKRNRVVYLKLKNEITSLNEVERALLDKLLLEHLQRFIYSDERYETESFESIPKSHYLDVNEEDWWERYTQQSIPCDMTQNSLTHFLKPILKYAKRVTLIDPYFTCYDDNFRNESHLKTLELIVDLINDDYMEEIVIHTSLKSMPKKVRLPDYYKAWQQTIDTFDLDIPLDVFIWEELPKGERFHNRYLFTNQASFGNPEGWSCWLKPQKSYIHLLDFKGNTDETNHLATTFNRGKVNILPGVKLVSNFE